MSYLLFKDAMVEANNSSITHTVSFGTDTAITDEEFMLDRSTEKAYFWSTSSSASVSTITITQTSNFDVSCVALLGCHADINSNSDLDVLLRNSGGSTIYGVSDPDITRRRQVDGVDVVDYVWIFDEVSNVRSIRVLCGNETSSSPFNSPVLRIGKIFAGEAVEINVKPRSLNYQFATQGEKTRTEGGQIIAEKGSVYMEAKFTTAATKESQVVSKFFEINYVSAHTEPIIFVPQLGETIFLYGTQKKPSTTQTLVAKKENEWLYETSFQLEEEL